MNLALDLIAIGCGVGVIHFAPIIWKRLPKRRLIDEFRAMEAVGERDFAAMRAEIKARFPRTTEALHRAEKLAQPIVQQAEMEYKTVKDDLQQKFASVGAKLTSLKAERDAAVQSAADLKAQLDAANAHIAELTANDAEVEGAVSALADQANQ